MSNYFFEIRQQKPGKQLISLLFIILVSAFLFSFLGLVSLASIQRVPFSDWVNYFNSTNFYQNSFNLKTLQVFNALGVFVVPSLLFAQIFYEHPANFLGFNTKGNWKIWLLSITSIYAFGPFIESISYWNENLEIAGFLGEFGEYFRNLHETTKNQIITLSEMNSFGSFLYALFVMAALPAIGEELLFRGIIQNLFGRLLKNMHWGILISGLLFALLHMQIFILLPIAIMGILFGYLRWWTGNLWIPILAHFLNNATMVFYLYFFEGNESEINTGAAPDYLVLIPTFISGLLFLFLLYRETKKSPRD